MRDKNRIPGILKRLETVWEEYPDLRLGQLLANLLEGVQLYYIEDEPLISQLEELYLRREDPKDA